MNKCPKTGKFLPGNKLGSKGGKNRAAALTPEKRSEIASQGFMATCEKYFNGNKRKMMTWLQARSNFVQDQSMAQGFYYQAPDPGPFPSAKED